jgi:FkbH-like protein
MLLRREHFASIKANWDSKSNNIASISKDLSLAPDSFVFIDDNPTECAEVQASLPQVLTIPLPQDLTRLDQFLSSLWDLDVGRLTAEDKLRACAYLQNEERRREEMRAPTLEEFFATLDLRVRIEALSSDQLARAAQLMNRTTQFTLRGMRPDKSEQHFFSDQLGGQVLSVCAKDRFGDYGMIGLFRFQPRDSCVIVDLFLLSCRALGKRIEHRMALWLAKAADRVGAQTMRFALVPSSRNRPIRKFLDELGVEFSADSAGIVLVSRVRHVCESALQCFTEQEMD